VDPTEERIRAGDTLGDLGSQPTEEFVEDFNFDKNGKLWHWRGVTLTMKMGQSLMLTELAAMSFLLVLATQTPSSI
jgi:5'-3' exonuclease